MISNKPNFQFANAIVYLLSLALCLGMFGGAAWAQITASITGTVKDTSGAVVPGAMITAKNLESGLARTAETDASGSYSVTSLPVGQYEVSAEKAGFKHQVRSGISLAVAQQAVVNLALEVGNVEQRVEVTAAAPIVNTTLSPTSGLIGEKEVKDLPLNGRSFDQLLTLNVGTVNYTSNSAVSRTGNSFSVAGRRPEESRFLVNGIDYPGSQAAGVPYGPGGASGQLLGVDAVREFNVVQHSYGAEYGKRAGGQISIVTSSGTNQLHGGLFEYLRNSVLDARNFFDRKVSPSDPRIGPFKRNQFGASLGGPLKKDKLFLFGNYEGFRQRLGLSSVAVVPDAQARQGRLPDATGQYVQVPNLKTGMLPFAQLFWPEANTPELLDLNGRPSGLALNISNPLQSVREDFGLFRMDYNVSVNDTFSANFLIDNGDKTTPNADPVFVTVSPQRATVLGFQETHVFSPTFLNTAIAGYSRADNPQSMPPTISIPANLSFISGVTPGTITIGGGISGTTASSIVPAGGQRLNRNVQNEFTWADDVHIVKGRHSLSAGVWIQRIQQNTSGPSVGNAGNVSYPSLLAFLQDTPTQIIANPRITPLGYRSTESAWFVQDEFKLKPNLTVRLGLRDEMTTGWSEGHGRCANYVFDANGIILTDPLIGYGCLLQNNAIALWQPRVGVAWDPTGNGTWAVRAGFGIYNDLQDTAAFRLTGNPPFNSRVTFTDPLLSIIPISGTTAPPPSCNAQLRAAGQRCSVFQPNGLDPNMHTPTVQEWSFTVEREITRDLMFQLGYSGSQAYHLVLSIDRNVAQPQICASAAGCVSGGSRAANLTGRVPQGTLYMPSTPGLLPNPYVSNTQSWMYAGNSSYHALSVSMVKRASRGLTFKANYTFSKVLDMNSATSATFGQNEPQDVLNPFDLKSNRGLAAFDLRHQFNANFSYELPFGRGRRWGSGAGRITEHLIGGWQWNGIFTAQSGFSFTPQVGANISGTGDTTFPDVPVRNPDFKGPVILHKLSQWFDPHAYMLPTPGTFGNVSRGSLIGPGLTTFDTSLFKSISITERWHLQFRAETFNILNHANFSTPSSVVFSGSNFSSSAGVITATSTTSRQIQFALKLMF